MISHLPSWEHSIILTATHQNKLNSYISAPSEDKILLMFFQYGNAKVEMKALKKTAQKAEAT